MNRNRTFRWKPNNFLKNNCHLQVAPVYSGRPFFRVKAHGIRSSRNARPAQGAKAGEKTTNSRNPRSWGDVIRFELPVQVTAFQSDSFGKFRDIAVAFNKLFFQIQHLEFTACGLEVA